MEEPDYPPQRGFVLVLLSLGVFNIVAAILALYYWLTFNDWRPYLGQIAGFAFLISLPLTYLIWGYYQYRSRS